MQEIENFILKNYKKQIPEKLKEKFIEIVKTFSFDQIKTVCKNMQKKDGKIDFYKLVIISEFEKYLKMFQAIFPSFCDDLDKIELGALKKCFDDITWYCCGFPINPYDYISNNRYEIIRLIYSYQEKKVPYSILYAYFKDHKDFGYIHVSYDRLIRELKNEEKILLECRNLFKKIKESKFYKLAFQGKIAESLIEKPNLKQQIINKAKGLKKIWKDIYWNEEKNIKIIFQENNVIILQDEKEFINESISKELIDKLEDVLKGV